MTTIKIDDKDYELESLTEAARQQLGALQVIDQEIRRLQLQISIANTARGVHAQLLKTALNDPLSGDSITLK